MKVAFDTSVLVASLVRAHPEHGRAIIWLEGVGRQSIDGVASWHLMAETWAVLTRLPLAPRLSGEKVRLMLERIRDRFELLAPTPEIYETALRRSAESGLTSGAVFDAIHLVTAEAAEADILVTFNFRHFDMLRTSSSPRLVVPPDPPSLDLNP